MAPTTRLRSTPRDTLLVGAGLNDASAVDVLTHFGTRSVLSLRDAGVPFAEDLGLEAGHARRRILHAGGGATGQVLTSALLARAEADPAITLFDHAPVAALVVENGHVVGVDVSCPDDKREHEASPIERSADQWAPRRRERGFPGGCAPWTLGE